MDLYETAIQRDTPLGQYRLACCYEAGRGVPKDWKKARELYQKAAAQKEPHAIQRIKKLEKQPFWRKLLDGTL